MVKKAPTVDPALVAAIVAALGTAIPQNAPAKSASAPAKPKPALTPTTVGMNFREEKINKNGRKFHTFDLQVDGYGRTTVCLYPAD